MTSKHLLVAATVAASAVVSWLVACGGHGAASSRGAGSALATVNTSLSDPPTCASPTTYNHVYVSVADVQMHPSASALPTDAGWIDLTPGLRSAPKQVDLLALGGSINGCILAQLGSNTQIQPGTYHQIRLYLALTSASVPGNQCGSTNSCVVFSGQTVPLTLSSETQTGIKISSEQIAGGSFTVGADEIKELDINFDACASIVASASLQFRLKPVLHAGEVSTSSSSSSSTISGQLVDARTHAPVAGEKAIVALEMNASGIDRMIMQTSPDLNGNFSFCPAPAGTYDVVAVMVLPNPGGTAYSATITSGVQAGNALGTIPMSPQPAPGTQQGTITGTVSTAETGGGVAEDVVLSALEQMTIGGSSVQVTIPLAQQQSTTLTVTATSNASCPANTFCTSYKLALPAALPFLGTFSTSGARYTQISEPAVEYTVDAQAFHPASASTPTCSPSERTTTSPVTVTPGVMVATQTLALSDCQ